MLSGHLVAGYHQPEVSDYGGFYVTVGDTQLADGSVGQLIGGPETLWDKDIFTGYSVPSTLPTN